MALEPAMTGGTRKPHGGRRIGETSPQIVPFGGAMRMNSLLIAALLAPSPPLAGQAPAPQADLPIPLDVMTFNIRTAEGRDGDNAWPHRKELVAETIGRFDPHVVGLQEVLAEQIDFLEAELPQYRWVGVDRGLNGGTGLSEATPIFYRYRELVPVESGTFWLSGDPDQPSRRRRASRIVTWARFHHLASGRQIHVFNTHFTLRRGPGQLRSAEQINARVASLPRGSAVIVMGDFNAVAESSDTWRVATGGGLRDAWVVADQRQGPPLTSNGFGPPPEGWEGRIDWILVGGPITVPSVATIVHSARGRYPSDHYPVLATLEIRPR
jgi:endonuclease/exonuclease/phosphatase family metal-dependent hydrolase